VVRGGLDGFARDVEVGDVEVLVLVGLGYGVVAGIASGFIVGKYWRADGEGGDGGKAGGGGDGGVGDYSKSCRLLTL
jgi:hypothetical protein